MIFGGVRKFAKIQFSFDQTYSLLDLLTKDLQNKVSTLIHTELYFGKISHLTRNVEKLISVCLWIWNQTNPLLLRREWTKLHTSGHLREKYNSCCMEKME